jgi:predicted ATPase
MPHLKAIGKKSSEAREDLFPFCVPAVRHLERLELRSPVTFFVGENGSGKSTLMEGIAAAMNAITVGGDDVERDVTLEGARLLASRLRLEWNRKTGRGFFLRAEDFFNFGRRLQRMQAELDDIIAGYREDLARNPNDEGIKRAIGYISGQKAQLVQRYGENLDHNSHGESFMKLFEARLVPGGLYLLDEPEAALSPLRQLAFLSQVKAMVAQKCQFLIATHSPILMAFPDAEIYSFDRQPIALVDYDELEHVTLTRAFLQDPQAFLRRL